MTITLNATIRTETGKKLYNLRKEGKLPAVVYGTDKDTVSVTLDAKEFDKVFKEAGESTVVILSGVDKDMQVLIHDVTRDPLRNDIQHVDLYTVKKGQKVTVAVPLVFTGEAPAIKLGGTLTKVLHEIELTAEPDKLPHEIEVDISSLKTFEDQIHISDIKLPTGVEVDNESSDVIAMVAEAKEETDEPTTLDMDEVKVEEKGKKEEGEEK